MAIKYLDAKRIRGELGKEWIISETANTGNVEITGGELEINSLGNASNNGSLAYVDLGASVVSSTEWILRWKWHFTSFSGNGSAPNTINVGLSSGKDGAGSAGNNQGNWSPTENIAMIFMSGDSDDTYFQQVNGTSANNVYDGSNTSRTNLVQSVSFSNTTYYMQLRRYSNSGTDTIEASYGTNSDYTTGRTTSTRTANMPTSLRYIKAEVWHHDTSGTTTNCHSEIDDVKFWNGTSTSGTPTYQTDFASNPPDDKATLVTAPPKCATFDGSNDKVTYTTLMSGTGAWSFSVWVYHTGGTSGNDGIVSANSMEQLLYQGSSQKFGMKMGTNSHIYTATTVAENTWYHLAGTRAANGDVKFYLNGAETNTASGDTGAVPTGDWVLGACGSEFWAGSIIEWAVWNGRVLSSSEVSTIYNSGTRLPDAGLSTAYTTNLTGYYPLDTNFDKFSGTGGGNGTNSGTLIEQSTPITPISASSVLPTNTIFEETDTKSYWWLQDSKWKGGAWIPTLDGATADTDGVIRTQANNTGAGDGVWTTEDTGSFTLDTTNKTLKGYKTSSTSEVAFFTKMPYKLSTDSWQVDYTVILGSGNNNNTNVFLVLASFPNADYSPTPAEGHEYIEVVANQGNSDNKWHTRCRAYPTGGSLSSITYGSQGSSGQAGGTYNSSTTYFRMTGTSTTVTVQAFTDSARTTQLGSDDVVTIDGTQFGLGNTQYIGVATDDNDINMNIKDIKVTGFVA